MRLVGLVPWYRRRKQLNVYVTPSAHEALADYAQRHGVTVSAVIEAIGQCLADDRPPNLAAASFIKRARAIVSERRSRRRV